jgi:hypothetical protein
MFTVSEGVRVKWAIVSLRAYRKIGGGHLTASHILGGHCLDIFDIFKTIPNNRINKEYILHTPTHISIK